MFKLKPVALAIAQVVSVVVLSGCGGNDAAVQDAFDSNGAIDASVELDQAERLRWRARDSIAPQVAITNESTPDASGSIGIRGTV